MPNPVYSPSYSQLIPLSEFAPGEAASIRNQVIEKALQLVSQQLNLGRDKLLVRDIRALSDLDFTYEDWWEKTGATVDAYETMSTGTMGQDRWIAIYGVKDDPDTAGSVTAIKFNIGGSDRVIWQIQGLNPVDGMVGITPNCILIPQNTPYTISRFVRSINASTHIVLKGVVVEKRGLVVSP